MWVVFGVSHGLNPWQISGSSGGLKRSTILSLYQRFRRLSNYL
jgi:hypothetical protein